MEQNIYNGTIGGPVLNEEGAVQTGHGYRLQFLGSDNPKEITKRVVIGVVAVALAVLLIATLLGGKQPIDFPDEMILLNAIGQPLEEAALKVGIKLADMTETEPGVYLSNKGIILDGVAFDLYFYAEDGICSGFAYIADYQADVKKASKDIYNTFVNLRIKSFAQFPELLNEEDRENLPEVTRRNIRKHLEDGNNLLVKHTYDYTPYFENLKPFIEKIEAADDWEGRVGEYVVRKAMLYMDKGGAYDALTQRVQLVLSYRIEPDRAGRYGGAY